MFSVKKLRIKVSLICVITLLILFYKLYYRHNYSISITKRRSSLLYQKNTELYHMKYVLKYSPTRKSLFEYIPDGHEIFLERKCSVTNCYFTSNRSLLNNIVEFDVILFFGPHIVRQNPKHYLPRQRIPSQSYIFVNTESADNHFVPDFRYNKVFNFTWTYKLNSDIYYGYISIRNKNGEVIGPKENISWISINDMLPIAESVLEKLKYKKFAAAWFVSNCHAHNRREKWVFRIDEELRKYNMSVDIFGACSPNKRCPRNTMAKCLKMLQRDYYFYFAFENSMSDDYVTEKLLYPLNNYAVPVVFGGADYRRFMPDGIYLNSREMSAKNLAKLMFEIINDQNKYHDFFKWHNHYSYHYPEGSSDTESFCEFCDFINKVNTSKNIFVNNFFEWWNPHIVMPAMSKTMNYFFLD